MVDSINWYQSSRSRLGAVDGLDTKMGGRLKALEERMRRNEDNQAEVLRRIDALLANANRRNSERCWRQKKIRRRYLDSEESNSSSNSECRVLEKKQDLPIFSRENAHSWLNMVDIRERKILDATNEHHPLSFAMKEHMEEGRAAQEVAREFIKTEKSLTAVVYESEKPQTPEKVADPPPSPDLNLRNTKQGSLECRREWSGAHEEGEEKKARLKVRLGLLPSPTQITSQLFPAQNKGRDIMQLAQNRDSLDILGPMPLLR